MGNCLHNFILQLAHRGISVAIRALALALFIISSLSPGTAKAVDISAPPAKRSFTTVLYKPYRLNKYFSGDRGNQIQEVKIVLRTNPHETDRHFDSLQFHKIFLSALESAKYRWQALYLPTSFRHQINAGGWEVIGLQDGITAYRPVHPESKHDRWLTPIVDYDLGLTADIELNFPSRNKLTILTTLSVLGDSPLWNTMKYRGGSFEKYAHKVLDKFEEKLKENHNLVEKRFLSGG